MRCHFYMIKTILFDLDGTLVYLMDLHFELEKHILHKVFDIDLKKEDWISLVGLPDPEFTIKLLEVYGISGKKVLEGFSQFDELKSKFMEGKNIAEYITVLPGVFELLESLRKKEVIIGLITGNPPKHGELILNGAKLAEFMYVKVYSVNCKSRDELIIEALKRINSKIKSTNPNSLPIKMNETIVVGDSIFDVRSAKNQGCISVGVCTGFANRKTLEQEKPDYIFDNLKNTDEFLKIL